MAKALVAMAAAASVLVASSAEASGFPTGRAAFVPQLTVNNDPEVCTPFVEAVRREFLESKYAMRAPFDIDVTDRDWPGAQVRWLFPHNTSEVGFGERDLKLKRHQSAVIADLDRDGSPEALALFGWVHSWQGANLRSFGTRASRPICRRSIRTGRPSLPTRSSRAIVENR